MNTISPGLPRHFHNGLYVQETSCGTPNHDFRLHTNDIISETETKFHWYFPTACKPCTFKHYLFWVDWLVTNIDTGNE